MFRFIFVTIIPLESWAIVLLLLFCGLRSGLGDGHYGGHPDPHRGSPIFRLLKRRYRSASYVVVSTQGRGDEAALLAAFPDSIAPDVQSKRSQLEIPAAPDRRECSIGPADSRESTPDKLRSLPRTHPYRKERFG